MNCPLEHSPTCCIKRRRRGYYRHHHPNEFFICDNCKAGIENERDWAEVRPPLCDNCGCWKPDNKSSLCFRCGHLGGGERGYSAGRSCKFCDTPISNNNRSGCCIECRPRLRVRKFRKTHCVRGHEYNEENSYINPQTGARKCRTCEIARCRRRRQQCA